jgi:hypothetical protein
VINRSQHAEGTFSVSCCTVLHCATLSPQSARLAHNTAQPPSTPQHNNTQRKAPSQSSISPAPDNAVLCANSRSTITVSIVCPTNSALASSTSRVVSALLGPMNILKIGSEVAVEPRRCLEDALWFMPSSDTCVPQRGR